MYPQTAFDSSTMALAPRGYIDVRDEICWRPLLDVGDGFDHFGHKHPSSVCTSVGHEHLKDCQQHHDVTNITVTVQDYPKLVHPG